MKSILAQDNHNSEFIKQCSPTLSLSLFQPMELSVPVTISIYYIDPNICTIYILFPTCLPSVVSQLGFSQFFLGFCLLSE